MKGACITKFQITLEMFSPKFNVVWDMNSVRNTAVIKNGKNQSIRKTFGVLLKDVSKALDCLPNYLVIAKLNVYGFSLSAPKLIHNYPFCRKQRTKINF